MTQPTDEAAVEPSDVAAQLRGRARYLYDKGRVKSPVLMTHAATVIETLRAQLTAATRRAEQLDHAMRLTDELFSTAFKQGSEEQHLWLFGDEGVDAWQTARAIIYDFNHEFHSEQAREFGPMKERAEQAERMLAEAIEGLEKISSAKVAFNAHPVGVIATMQEWASKVLTAIRSAASGEQG